MIELMKWPVVIFSACAALAWLKAATARVAAKGKPGDLQIMVGDTLGDYSFIVDNVDVIATAALQATWNKYAASAACLAALFQALQSLLS